MIYPLSTTSGGKYQSCIKYLTNKYQYQYQYIELKYKYKY